MPLSYRSPTTEVRESKIHGRGLFAIADIAKDQIVAVKGGYIVDRKTLREKITPRLGPVDIQIDDDLFIAPVTDEERELSMLYSNHSCNANLGVRGEITFVAMRKIHAGEELTHDWATTDDDDYSVECNAARPIAGKLSPARTGNASNYKNVMQDISPLILRAGSLPAVIPSEARSLTIEVAVTRSTLCDARPSERSFAPFRMTTRTFPLWLARKIATLDIPR